MKQILRRILAFFLDSAETLTTSLAIFLILYLFVGQHSQVKGMSMFPNLFNNDSLVVSKISYELGSPLRGDVVVFVAPQAPEDEFVKRVIGIPGDTVEIRGGQVYINGKVEPASYLPAGMQTVSGKFMREGKPIKIPDGFYLVMGDNRLASSDSREWGLVPRKNIVGKVVFRFWPANEFGKINQVNF